MDEVTVSETAFRIELVEHPRTEDVSGLIETLCARRASPVQLIASRVRVVTTPLLQALIAAKRQWDADKHELEVLEPSDAFTDALRLFGLSSGFFEKQVDQ